MRGTVRYLRVAIAACILGSSWSFGAVAAPPPTVVVPTGDSASGIVRETVAQLRRGARLTADDEPIASTILLPAFYERRQFEPAWSGGAIDSLIEAVRSSVLDGLDPTDYHLAALLRVREALAGSETSARTRATADLVATDALIRLGYHARFGKVDQQQIFGSWNFAGPLTDIDPVELMERAIGSAAVREAVESLFPQHPFYRALRAALARYRAIGVAGGWDPTPGGSTLKPGTTDARVPALRHRLVVEGDLADVETEAPLVFDPALAAAVARFQSRHGLPADGSVGAGTIRALNVPVSARIDQIRINLDRARSVMHDLPRRFVLVNVAGFTVYFVDADWPIWESRVVVGKPFTQTPIFRADMEYVVLNPTWTVPSGIMKGEILPGIRRDPNYLAQKGLEWRDGQVVQPAGPKNALGRIKLMFPNPYSVYLHDTPARALFAQTERTFSHGCIRVQKPVELAALALDDAATWTPETLEEAIATGLTQTVSLKGKPPVLVLYWTATVGESGALALLDDPYKRDPPTLTALDAPFSFRNPRTLLPSTMLSPRP